MSEKESILSSLRRVRRCDYYRLRREYQRTHEGKKSPQKDRQERDRKKRDRQEDNLRERIDTSIRERERRRDQKFKLDYPDTLPVANHRQELIEAITKNRVTIVAGETGSGKTTLLPLFCLEAGRGIEGKIGCTQPRRIAATSIARRLAEELGESLGNTVSYKIRFDEKGGVRSRIKVMSDGILLAETQSDHYLNQYDTLIIDEAHERSLNIDFLLGYLRNLLERRKDLKIILTSATLQTEKFVKFFTLDGVAPALFCVEGRGFPITDHFISQEEEAESESLIDLILLRLEEIFTSSSRGDVLIFLPSESDIRECLNAIDSRQDLNCLTLPLFARLAKGEQQKIFTTSSQRKVIVATNIAETSLTIPNIFYVIDSGLARIGRYSPVSGLFSLPITPVSKSSLLQRRGRCGRVGPGTYYALFQEGSFEERELYTPPEIERANLAEVILRMISLKLTGVEEFPFLDPPSDRAIQDGYRILQELLFIQRKKVSGEKRKSYELTQRGRRVLTLPFDPRLRGVLLQAERESALCDVYPIVCALSLSDLREFPEEKKGSAKEAHQQWNHPDSDFLWYDSLWRELPKPRFQSEVSWSQMRRFARKNYLSSRRLKEWIDLCLQTKSILEEGGFQLDAIPLKRDGLPSPSTLYRSVHRSFLSGFLSHIGRRKESRFYQSPGNKTGEIFPASILFFSKKKENHLPEWVVAYEWVNTSRLFLRTVAKIESDWLLDLGSHLIERSYKNPQWSEEKEYVLCEEERRISGFLIGRKTGIPYERINPKEATEIFIQEVLLYKQESEKLSYPFLVENRKVRDEVMQWEDRLRQRSIYAGDEALRDFYFNRLFCETENLACGGLQQLDRYLKRFGEDSLLLKKEELIEHYPDIDSLEQFPVEAEIEGESWRLDYLFEPTAKSDGATIQIPHDKIETFDEREVDWLVPGLIEEKVFWSLKSLGKQYRKRLIPLKERAKSVAEKLPREGDFYAQLYTVLQGEGLSISPDDWSPQELFKRRPEYLKPNFQVIDHAEKILFETRNIREVKEGSHRPVLSTREEKKIRQREEIWDLSEYPKERALPHLISSKGSKESLSLFLALHYAGDSGDDNTDNRGDNRAADRGKNGGRRGNQKEKSKKKKFHLRLFYQKNLANLSQRRGLIHLFYRSENRWIQSLSSELSENRTETLPLLITERELIERAWLIAIEESLEERASNRGSEGQGYDSLWFEEWRREGKRELFAKTKRVKDSLQENLNLLTNLNLRYHQWVSETHSEKVQERLQNRLASLKNLLNQEIWGGYDESRQRLFSNLCKGGEIEGERLFQRGVSEEAKWNPWKDLERRVLNEIEPWENQRKERKHALFLEVQLKPDSRREDETEEWNFHQRAEKMRDLQWNLALLRLLTFSPEQKSRTMGSPSKVLQKILDESQTPL